jgi:hypothetical protein
MQYFSFHNTPRTTNTTSTIPITLGTSGVEVTSTTAHHQIDQDFLAFNLPAFVFFLAAIVIQPCYPSSNVRQTFFCITTFGICIIYHFRALAIIFPDSWF